MKRFFFLIIIFVPILHAWAQEKLTLPVVSPEVDVRNVPAEDMLTPLSLPNVVLEQSTPRATLNFSPLGLPEAQSQVFEITTQQFEGLNLFVPVDKLSRPQALKLTNLVPEGLTAIKKRDGFEKIHFTSKGNVYGMAIAYNDYAQIIAVATESLFYADSSTSWELTKCDDNSDTLTYFVSTPFGVVVLNGGDTARIWNGSAIDDLGEVDTVTVASVANDTIYATDTTWTADYWVGYFAKCGQCTTHLEILDNGTFWLYAPTLCATDSCDAGSLVTILARPDSVGSDLGYPNGVAGAYFQDRFFVSSSYFDNRLYYSAVRDLDDITPDTSFINLDMDQHDQIVAMRVFNGNLIVFGKYSIYGIDASRNVTPITKVLGTDAPHTIALGDDYIYFKAGDGIYRFNGNVYGSMSYKIQKISDMIDDVLNGIDPQYVEYCGGLYIDKQYWFSYHPDSCVVFDERTNQWYGPQTFGFTSAFVYASVFDKSWDENLYPSADADSTRWAKSTGATHYECINTPGDNTKWVTTDSDSIYDSYEMSNTAQFPDGATVDYLRLYMTGRNRSGYTNADVHVYVTTTAGANFHYLQGFHNFPANWRTLGSVEYTNPVTGVAWTKGDLDSLELAIVSNHPDAGDSSYVSALWVKPQYEGDLALSSFLFASPDKSFIYKYGGTFTDDTTTTGQGVYGEHVTVNYQSGFFNADLPVNDKLLRQFYCQTEQDTGNVLILYYADFSTTASDTDTVNLSGKGADWFVLGENVKGKNFSIGIKNTSNVDSLTIKGWSALVKNIGLRGGK